MDNDLIVRRDIGELYRNSNVGGDGRILGIHTKVAAFVPRKNPRYDGYLELPRIQTVLNKRPGSKVTIDGKTLTFNAGVAVFDLEYWRKNNLEDEVHFCMRENSKQKLFNYGTNPLLLLVLYDKWGKIDSRWNVDGLPWRSIKRHEIDSAYIWHWSGFPKPWEPKGKYADLWKPYFKTTCHK